jgi:hypothetical protein
MPWTPDATLTTWTKSTSNREVYVLSVRSQGWWELTASVARASDNIRLLVRGSGDGGTGWLCGINGSDVEIRRCEMRVVAGAPAATAAHGIVAGEPFTLRVRGLGDVIEVAVLKTDSATVAVQNTSTDFMDYSRLGIESDVAGAVVLGLALHTLVSVYGQVQDVLWCVAGGNLYASYDGLVMGVLRQGMFAPSVQVSGDVWDGKVYLVGGGRAWVWDVLTRDITPASANNHPTVTLPGALEEGSTTANLIRQFLGRLGLAGMEESPNNLHWSAIAEPLEHDTGELAEGRAVVEGAARGVTATDAIVALEPTSTNSLLIGCANSLYMRLGDPGDPSSEVVPVSRSVGVSGPQAIASTNEGAVVLHSPEGIMIVVGSSEPAKLSAAMIRRGMQIPREQRTNYRVTLIRDPARHGLHVWLTPETSSVTGAWWWYDETDGQYSAGAGGWWPEQYAPGLEPLTACVWRGHVVIFTTDGHVVRFDDSHARDVETPFTSRVNVYPVGSPTWDKDVILERVELTLGNDSGAVTVCGYVGANVEDVVLPESRQQVWESVVSPISPVLWQCSRGPAVLIEIKSQNQWWAEEVIAEVREDRRLSMRRIFAAPGAAPACTPADPTPTPPTDSGGSGPGPGNRPTGGGGGGGGTTTPTGEAELPGLGEQ